MVHIQVVGLGCPRCANLAHRAEAAVQRLGKVYRLEKVNDLTRILEFGVAVPALVIDGVVRSTGTVPTVAEIQEMLRDCDNSKEKSLSEDLPAGTQSA
jgi:small redox-active disulfide protein 2